jgi:Fe2+ or Zn2+ uptake regulation protein
MASIFIRYLGNSPKIRILDYLLTVRELDFSLTDIAENSGIGRATLYRLLDDMIKEKIIIPTRTVGRAKLFKLNMENTQIKQITKLYDSFLLQNLKQGENKKPVKKETRTLEAAC